MRNLQDEAVAICVKHFIRLEVDWILREVICQNFICKDNFRLAAKVFATLNQLWRPHSVDWLASHLCG